jgi:anti-sigma factor RsiW
VSEEFSVQEPVVKKGAAMNCDEVTPLLNARVDDEIDPIRRSAFDSHVRSCVSCTKDLEDLESVRDAIRNEMRYYKAPEGLRDQVRFSLRGAEFLDRGQPRRDWKVWGAIAAGIGVFALASAPVLVNSRNQSQLMAEELLSAHQRALVGQIVDVISSDQHTVKPWFNGKLPFSPPVADLASEGFPLQGGRLDYAGGRPVSALVYGRHLHRIDVFVWPASDRKGPPSNFERNGYNEVSWTKNDFLFTAVSDLNAAELAAFAKLLQNR